MRGFLGRNRYRPRIECLRCSLLAVQSKGCSSPTRCLSFLVRSPRRSPYGNRTVSLHTLLDQEPEDSVAASSDLPTPSHQHGEGQRLQPERSEGSERRKQSAPWARKQEVIDGVNELIEELKDIDSAIANQVRFVRRDSSRCLLCT